MQVFGLLVCSICYMFFMYFLVKFQLCLVFRLFSFSIFSLFSLILVIELVILWVMNLWLCSGDLWLNRMLLDVNMLQDLWQFIVIQCVQSLVMLYGLCGQNWVCLVCGICCIRLNIFEVDVWQKWIFGLIVWMVLSRFSVFSVVICVVSMGWLKDMFMKFWVVRLQILVVLFFCSRWIDDFRFCRLCLIRCRFGCFLMLSFLICQKLIELVWWQVLQILQFFLRSNCVR